MLFPTFTFALFFMVVLTVGLLMPGRRAWWKLFMLAASYFFYAFWDARFVGLIAASTVLNQIAAVAISRLGNRADLGNRAGTGNPSSLVRKQVGENAAGGGNRQTQPGGKQRRTKRERRENLRRTLLVISLVGNLTTLGFFKYADFFVDSAQSLLRSLGVTSGFELLNIILPVGISFFTFQAISYVVDVYRGDTKPAKPLDFALYLAFFPQLVAGPIVRANELIPQINQPRQPRVDFAKGCTLIAAGLFKKMVIATYLAEALVDDVFAFPNRFGSLEILLGIYGYAIQIYADFSGYTDIAIGVALLMGIQLPLNFAQPYRAVTLRDFWKRWHISLSRWLRDYLYIPLGGSRCSELKRDRNLLLTMLLGGLWHGANWTFVIWGAMHGVWLLLERRLRFRVRGVLGWFITFHFVCLSWVFFRAESFGNAGDVLAQLFTGGSGLRELTWVFPFTALGMLATHFISQKFADRAVSAVSQLPGVLIGAGMALWLMLIEEFGPEGIAPFIYFQF